MGYNMFAQVHTTAPNQPKSWGVTPALVDVVVPLCPFFLFLSFFLISHSGTTTLTKAGVTPHDFGWLAVVVWTCGNMLYSMANYLQGRILIKIDFFLEHSMVVVSDFRFIMNLSSDPVYLKFGCQHRKTKYCYSVLCSKFLTAIRFR